MAGIWNPNLRDSTSKMITSAVTRNSQPTAAPILPSTALMPSLAASIRSMSFLPSLFLSRETAVARSVLQVTVLAPDVVVGAELGVGVPHLLEVGVLARLLRHHL